MKFWNWIGHLPVIIGSAFGVLAIRFLIVLIVTSGFGLAEETAFLALYNAAIFLTSFSDFGLRTTLFVRAVTPEKQPDLTFFDRARRYRLTFGLLALALMLIYLAFFSTRALAAPLNLTPLSWTALATGFGCLAANAAMADTQLQMLRGIGRARTESLIKFAESACLLTLTACAVYVFQSLPLVALSFAISTTLRTLLSHRALKEHLQSAQPALPELELEGSHTRPASSASTPFFSDVWAQFKEGATAGSALLLHLYIGRFPILIGPLIGLSHGLNQIALALMVLQAASVVSSSFAFYFLPKMSLAETTHPKARAPKITKLLAGLSILGTLFAAALILLYPLIYHVFGLDGAPQAQLAALIFLTAPLFLVLDFFRFEFSALYIEKQMLIALAMLAGLATLYAVLVRPDITGLCWLFVASQVLYTGVMSWLYVSSPARKNSAATAA